MTRPELIEQIKSICVDLSGQMVDGAHYVINNADEIPFYSMREIARRANVQPVNLVRLAQKLGLNGYKDLRQQFIDTTPERPQRDRLSLHRNEASARTLIAEMGKSSGLKAFVDFFLRRNRPSSPRQERICRRNSLRKPLNCSRMLRKFM